MTAELRQYSGVAVSGTWVIPTGTIDILDGRVSEEFFAEEQDNDTWSLETDGNANATRVKDPRKSGTLTITLSASSPTNDVLSGLAIADAISENVVGLITLQDFSGSSKLIASGAFIPRRAALQFAMARGSRIWRWRCAAVDAFVGGHRLA